MITNLTFLWMVDGGVGCRVELILIFKHSRKGLPKGAAISNKWEQRGPSKFWSFCDDVIIESAQKVHKAQWIRSIIIYDYSNVLLLDLRFGTASLVIFFQLRFLSYRPCSYVAWRMWNIVLDTCSFSVVSELKYIWIFWPTPNFVLIAKVFFQRILAESDMVKHELQVASYELRVESLKARVEIKSTSWNSKVRVTSSDPRVTSSNLRVASSSPRIIKSMKTQVSNLKSSWFPETASPKLFGSSWGNLFVQFLVIILFRFSLFHGNGFSRKLRK